MPKRSPHKDAINVHTMPSGRETVPIESTLAPNQRLVYAKPDFSLYNAHDRKIGTWYAWNHWFSRSGTPMESIYGSIDGINYHGKKAEETVVVVLTEYARRER